MMRQRPVPASSVDPAKFAVGDLVAFVKPSNTAFWTDEILDNGEWREQPLKIYEDTPAIVLRSRLVDDDKIENGGEVDLQDADEYCYVVYDLLVSGNYSFGWQEEALRKV